jgi:MFS transporter, OFA family, oxalate/formate antiporter
VALVPLRAIAVIAAGFLTVSIAYAIRYGYGIFLPEMIAELAISKTQAGLIASAYFVAYTLFSPLLGYLSDRFDVRIILSLFTALLAGGALCMALADDVWSAGVFFALAGIGHSACWAPVVALVQRWVPDRRRGLALSLTTMGAGVGIALWSLLLPLIIANSGWRSGWLALGGFALIVAGINFLLVRRSPETHADPGQGRTAPANGQKAGSSQYRELLRGRVLWLIGLAYLLVGFTVLVPFTFLTVHAMESHAFPYGEAGRLLAIIALAGMAGKLVLGILSDSLGRVRVMLGCGLLLGVGCLGMALGQTVPALYVAVILFGVGWGAVWPVYAAAAADFFPRSRAGSVIGIWTVFLGVGSILSPVLCGWLIDISHSYLSSFLLGSLGGLFSALLLVPLLKTARVAVAE